MPPQTKWYQRNGLLLFFILFLYPIGLVGIWLRDTHPVKKLFFSFAGFFAFFFTFTITLVVFAAIFFPTDYYEKGQQAYAAGNYELAVSDFSQVGPDDEHYQEAQSMIEKANKKIEEEKARQEAIVQASYLEVRKNVFPIVYDKDNYTVMLHDMALDEQPNDTTFAHKYRILIEDETGMPRDTITDWLAVSDTTFDYYINDQTGSITIQNYLGGINGTIRMLNQKSLVISFYQTDAYGVTHNMMMTLARQ